MEEVKTKERIWLRVLCIVLASIIFLLAAAGITVYCVWANEINTVASFTKIRERNDAHKDGAVYRMDVSGGFYFDEFLKEGASNDKELISFITRNVTKGLLGNMGIGETDIGCSSFTAVTESGDRLFARNYDFDKTNVCLTICDPGNGRHKSFSTVDLNFVGMDPEEDVEGLMNKITCLAAPFTPLDGINDAGLSCGIYMSYQGTENAATDERNAEKGNITSTTMLRMVLDYASTVEEAVDLIKKYNLHDSANTSFHYMIADATGKSAILEWVPVGGTDATDNDGTARNLKVYYNDDDAILGEREKNCEFQWITNFILTPHYYDGLEEEMHGKDRYDDIYSLINKDGTNSAGIIKDEQAAMDILAYVGRRNYKEGDGVTVHSVVYNLTQKTAFWVANENYGDKSACFEYSLKTGELKQLG